ncbi:MAG: hypothetical protein M1826_000048 [Phylliscum demangeonii]|nr:MAG: hypothetical protein M1826_000048 [Phylliscum demangeonii]
MSLMLGEGLLRRAETSGLAALLCRSYHGRAAPYRRISPQPRSSMRALTTLSDLPARSWRPGISRATPLLLRVRLVAARQFHSPGRLFREPHTDQEVKDPPREEEKAAEADDARSQSQRQHSGESSSEEESAGKENGGKEDEATSEKDDAPPPPPPPHGNKTPWQVFTETLRSEFEASKEWTESTKALASSANQFTQNESVKRARAAYTAASDVATSTTSSALRGTGKALGKGAAWTWETPVVRGVRAGVNATGKAIEKGTRPVRETDAYKKAVGGVKDVIDDGSSSRYGGWIEKEERRKKRELREFGSARGSAREGGKAEPIEENPKAGTNITLHKDAAWKESWRDFKDSSRVMQSLFSLKSSYQESENPFICTARGISDRVAGFFAENETARVIKKFREMDPSFQLEPFLRDLREYILPEVLDAYVKGDVDTLKLWLSSAQFSVYAALAQQYTVAGLKSDGRILDIRHVDILSARIVDPGEIPIFIITCRTQEVHVYRNAKTSELAAGMEDKVQLVTYAIGVTRIPEDVLLVPITFILLTSRDRESGAQYRDFVKSDDFLGSHVLRVPARPTVSEDGKTSAGRARDGRGKVIQFNTVNGKSVIFREGSVFSNRGFKNLAQAQLVGDTLWTPGQPDAPKWLVYFISSPLLGSPEICDLIDAPLPGPHLRKQPAPPPVEPEKVVRSFNDILDVFPMIARQMQPELERLFNKFGQVFGKPLPLRPLVAEGEPSSDVEDDHPPNGVVENGAAANGHVKPLPKIADDEHEEARMRSAVENLITSAIDLFQLVGRHQLSVLGTTTKLTGPMVERMIERYVIEQIHTPILFPSICATKRLDDRELDAKIRQVENLDISQVGIVIPGGMQGKHELLRRLDKGVAEFRKLGTAGSPQESMELLLATEKAIATVIPNRTGQGPKGDEATDSEKLKPAMTINADTLVSMLLIVVIRAKVKNLHARLAYMHDFIFIDDVQGGEVGYALSTFEAVLSYLVKNSGGLRKISRRNKLLWEATKSGQMQEMKTILRLDSAGDEVGDSSAEGEAAEDSSQASEYASVSSGANGSVHDGATTEGKLPGASESSILTSVTTASGSGSDRPSLGPARMKRVSMDMQSVSSSSGVSLRSRATTIDSRTGELEGDASVDRLSKTHDPAGESVMMMAIENNQPGALAFLLSLKSYYPPEAVLGDCNSMGTTLLSAAIQTGRPELISIMLDYVLQAKDPEVIEAYLARQDDSGRTMAHYLFNAHHLIPELDRLLPWRTKDKNGQTPLLALCRSYDHPSYQEMIGMALSEARTAQLDGQRLHLDDHVDAKGNTLLHVVNDAQLLREILVDCDADVNAANEKRFTPLMVASKYGRLDLVTVFLADARVDVNAKDLRALTAVELAKNDEVRNRIDDFKLLSAPPDAEGRTAAVVRSFFADDASVHLVVKSAVPASKTTVTITTCRRHQSEFERLARCLAMEHPASWLPSLAFLRSPFQIASRPSRALLRDCQQHLDAFLRILLAHPTFSSHEMVWEFLLMPDLVPELMEERSRRKATAQAERIRDEYAPVTDVRDVELFSQHARHEVRGVQRATRLVIRRVNNIRVIESDLSDAHRLCARALINFSSVLGPSHLRAFQRFSDTLANPSEQASPLNMFHADLEAIATTISAMLVALALPDSIVDSITLASRAADRHRASLRRSDRWPLGLLDETRNKMHQEAAARLVQTGADDVALRCRLRFVQQTVAAELAAWQEMHAVMVKRAIRSFARRTVVLEKARLEGLQRAVRGVL